MGAGNDFTITHDGSTGATIAASPLTLASTGTMILDASDDITLDTGNGRDIWIKSNGTTGGNLTFLSDNNLVLRAYVQEKKIIFKGRDSTGTNVDALHIDMSGSDYAGGSSTTGGGKVYHSLDSDGYGNGFTTAGSGAGPTNYSVSIMKFGHEIVTTFLIDIEGLFFKQTDISNDVYSSIGGDTNYSNSTLWGQSLSNSQFYRLDAGTNGKIYKYELICVEVPDTSSGQISRL